MTTNKPTGEMHTPDPRVQAHTAQSATGEAAGLTVLYSDFATRLPSQDGFERVYLADDVDALLAAKDAKIARLTEAYREMREYGEAWKAAHDDRWRQFCEADKERHTLRPLADIGRLAIACDLAAGEDDLDAQDAADDAYANALAAYLANPATATEEE